MQWRQKLIDSGIEAYPSKGNGIESTNPFFLGEVEFGQADSVTGTAVTEHLGREKKKLNLYPYEAGDGGLREKGGEERQ